MRVRRSREADLDLDEIWASIAADNAQAAERLISRVVAAEQRLALYPELGQARPDIAPEARHWPVGRYLILYRIDPDVVSIMRIVHGARDLPALFEP